jgi:hypothetical protein
MIVDVYNKNDSEQWPGTRNEQVFFKGNKWASYEKIIAAITPEEQEQLLSHRINIKNITDFEAILSENALSFWYLFFGCETIKNPSALIHINMIFDLINIKEFTWDDLAELPMKPKGSIQRAMQLNKYYCSGMPHHYSYQTQQHYASNTDSLIERELAITEKWLKFKLGKSVGTYLIDKSKSDNGALEAIWGLMIESFEGWGLSSVLSDDSAYIDNESSDSLLLMAEFSEIDINESCS